MDYLYRSNFFLQFPQNRCFVFLLSVPKSVPHLSHFVLIIVAFQLQFTHNYPSLNVGKTINDLFETQKTT
jgi:hypothetical protein